MLVIQWSSTLVCQRLNVIRTRWRKLVKTTCDPYRPELHYMRGPGPKWHAKRQGSTESRAL
jgi:hypothetical protein